MVLHEKYGEITIGTAGTYNYAVIGPDFQLKHPLDIFGVIKPPYKSALSSWEDPSYVKIKSWSPFESWSSFKYQLNLIAANISKTFVHSMLFFSPLVFPVILLAFWFYLRSSDMQFKWGILCLLISIALIFLSYVPVFVETRYLFLMYLLLFLLGAYILSNFIQKYNSKNVVKILSLTLFSFFFIIPSCASLESHAYSNNGIYELSETLKNDYGIQGNIASDSELLTSILLTYFLDSSYYGRINTTNSSLEVELQKNNIDYYLIWNTTGTVDLNNYKEINNPNFPYPRIFSR